MTLLATMVLETQPTELLFCNADLLNAVTTEEGVRRRTRRTIKTTKRMRRRGRRRRTRRTMRTTRRTSRRRKRREDAAEHPLYTLSFKFKNKERPRH